MASQKALVVPQKGADFQVDSIPVPVPKKDELLVKVKVAALNPVDEKIRQFGLLFETLLEGGVSNEYDGFQQYALADAHTTAIIPDSISYEEAGTLPLALSTAYVGMYNTLPHGIELKPFTAPGGTGAYSGQAIFISGGPSSVGQAAIQFAKLSGFSYILTTASLGKHTEHLKSLGATHVIDRNLPLEAFRAELAKIEGLPKIEYAFDSIGDAVASFAYALEALAPNGKVASVNPRFPFESADNNGKQLARISAVKTLPTNVDSIRALWGDLTKFLESGALKGSRFEVLPGGLAAVADGVKRFGQNQVSGVKLLVHPDETA
ncbi:hypothetical protein DFP72DRAFT_1121994 [Ephemerocybe angulata]|uniref:Enoyl reductase (ER) domain-containing protein n=1 Tax=Ephemerocybe angulata TaxID=980116 RepID=A0A8H6HZN9_9AGAR|nr:hypothetical protein DFP72DRAFT_1121994 [Tulosesus angulatus]